VLFRDAAGDLAVARVGPPAATRALQRLKRAAVASAAPLRSTATNTAPHGAATHRPQLASCTRRPPARARACTGPRIDADAAARPTRDPGPTGAARPSTIRLRSTTARSNDWSTAPFSSYSDIPTPTWRPQLREQAHRGNVLPVEALQATIQGRGVKRAARAQPDRDPGGFGADARRRQHAALLAYARACRSGCARRRALDLEIEREPRGSSGAPASTSTR
jgi:hypothetical protein